MDSRRIAAPRLTGNAAPDSQAAEEVDVARMVQAMMKSTRKRREARKEAIVSEYSARVAKMKHELAAIHHERRKQLIEARRAHLQILHDLVAKRISIEEKIAVHVQALEVAYVDMSQALCAMLHGRMEDLER